MGARASLEPGFFICPQSCPPRVFHLLKMVSLSFVFGLEPMQRIRRFVAAQGAGSVVALAVVVLYNRDFGLVGIALRSCRPCSIERPSATPHGCRVDRWPADRRGDGLQRTRVWLAGPGGASIIGLWSHLDGWEWRA